MNIFFVYLYRLVCNFYPAHSKCGNMATLPAFSRFTFATENRGIFINQSAIHQFNSSINIFLPAVFFL